MIKDKKDLREYMEADRISLGRKRKRPKLNDLVWKYEIALRKCEYYANNKRGLNKLFLKMSKSRLFVLGTICGYSISINTVGKGLSLAHVGPVIISSAAKIGENCRIHVGVNIGTAAGTTGQAPTIGNNVYIGPGAKIFGPITIGNDVAIGANAVVNKSFEENHITIAGIPAKKISDKGSEGYLFKASEPVGENSNQ